MTLDISDSSGDQSAELASSATETKGRLQRLSSILNFDATEFWKDQEDKFQESKRTHFLEYRDSPDVEKRMKAASLWWFSDAEHDLFSKLFTDSDSRVRLALAKNLWAQSKFPEQHQELFHDPDVEVRIAMIKADSSVLRQNPHLVRELLDNPEKQVKIALLRNWVPSWRSDKHIVEFIQEGDPEVLRAAQQNRFLRQLMEQV